MQSKQTFIFPTNRAIRHELLSLKKSTLFLPNHITISEFIKRVCIIDGFKKVDNDIRTLLLLEASNFSNFSELQIERNFFTFTKNSSYIFALLRELSGEKRSFNDLEVSDTYGDYEEHLSILNKLYEKYEQLCLERKIFDLILVPKLYRFNDGYVKTLGEITFILEGYLTAFEFEILEKVAKITNLKIQIMTSAFSKKMISKFEHYGIVLKEDMEYLIDFTGKKIISEHEYSKSAKIESISFSEQILQVAFVKQKVYEYLQKGFRHEDIAVVLPNVSFAQHLRNFDTEGNFNFSMGKDFTLTQSYGHLSAVCEYIENPSAQNGARVQRYKSSFYELIASNYYHKIQTLDFEKIIQEFCELLDVRAEREIIEEELHTFLKHQEIYKDLTLKATLHLFMQRLTQRAIDDVRGGKITVIGVLETRHIGYEAVIIVDFNESYVPKKSDKDLFLNSDIRSLAMLPTQYDRENLQKHYYALLMARAKYVAISHVKSLSSMPSRFLTELGIKSKTAQNESEFAEILYNKNSLHLTQKEELLIQEYDFSRIKISATSLKTYLDCKRKYYNRYILFLKKHEMPQDFASEYKIGLCIHEALKNVYLKSSYFENEQMLRSELLKELQNVSGSSSLEEYQLKLWSKKLNSFIANEIERFHNGYRVKECEKNLTCKHEGFELTGQVDRIDTKDGKLYVLDYKSGKYPSYTPKTVEKATDFQLEFYYLLVSTLGQVTGCGYYDLGNGKIVAETLLNEKLELLKKHLQEMSGVQTINFEKTEDRSHCQYCEFKLLCGREDV